jgi:predicted ATPase with chaperone activity
LLDPIFQSLRQRQLLINSSSAQLGDFCYTLTDQGRQRARASMEQCSYLGAAPVPLDDYIVSVDAQSIRAEAPQKRHLMKAFADISVEADMFDMLGPAVNSGAGLFLYGAPGNGKTTLAKRINHVLRSSIWIPRTDHRRRPVHQAV